MTSYLRVKKWKDWQHYKDREPPWVKLWASLLRDGAFLELSEPEQWQLVRVWMVCSLATRFTLDEKGRTVPVVLNDESSVRRATASLKRVPLRKFLAGGWLIEVAVEDTFDASAVIAPGKHPPPETVSVNGDTEDSCYHPLEAEKQRTRDLDTHQSRSSALPEIFLKSERRLFEVLTDMDANSPKVLRPLLELLPAASIEFTRNEVLARQPRSPTGYAVEVLTRQIQDRNDAKARREAEAQ